MDDESSEDGSVTESGTDEDEEEPTEPPVVADAADLTLVRHVDAIAPTWHLWNPEDPVHQLIKRAIDNTPVADD